jgi:CheY-like chemotaxis protein
MNACQPAAAPVEAGRPAERVVLVVEDEVVLRMAVSAHLREAGFVVIEAVDAEEAVALLGANRSIGLVFTDVTMPGSMDGNALAAWVAARYPLIKILVSSGVTQESGLPFLAKPYSFIELQQRIESMLPE